MSDLELLQQRLEKIREKRSIINQKKSRLEGRLESAEQSLSQVQEECRSKGVDPEKIDEVLLKLSKLYEDQVVLMEKSLEDCNKKLKDLMENEI
jgi:hypothetical protein